MAGSRSGSRALLVVATWVWLLQTAAPGRLFALASSAADQTCERDASLCPAAFVAPEWLKVRPDAQSTLVTTLSAWPSAQEWTAISARNQPVLVRQSAFAQGLLRLGDWSPAGLSKSARKRVLAKVYNCSSADVLYAREDRPIHMEESKHYGAYELLRHVELDAATFFHKMTSQVAPYYYFSGTLLANDGKGEGILPEAMEQGLLSHADGLKVLPPSGKAWRGEFTLWMVPSGAAARAHHDYDDNIVVQMSGRKTFYLLPPDCWVAMRMFPRIHPSDRSSQLTDDGAQGTLVSVKDRAVVVTLEPGDALFLPMFWFHRVLTSAASVSINGWSNTDWQDVLDSIFDNALPFHDAPGQTSKAIDAAAFATMLRVVRNVKGGAAPDAKRFVRVLIESQFAGLLKFKPQCDAPFAAVLSASLGRAVDSAAAATEERFRGLPLDSVREIALGLYAQGISHWIGGVDKVSQILMCLQEALD